MPFQITDKVATISDHATVQTPLMMSSATLITMPITIMAAWMTVLMLANTTVATILMAAITTANTV